MNMLEKHEEEFRETKVPYLRVATGGRGPRGPVGPVDNWLEKFPTGTVFACKANANAVDWEMYFLVHKFERIYLLKIETPDGKVLERRVDPKVFQRAYRDFEEVAYHPITEAPEGDEHGSSGERNPD
jgi:hypothetical protein